MRGVALFVMGMFAGATLMQQGTAPEARVRSLNHVGIVVQNYKEALAFYTDKLGIKEAYTIRRPDGSPQLTYLQLSRDTFIELIPASANQQTGITHFGVEVADVQVAANELRGKGIAVTNPAPTPANAMSTRIRDADGVQIEVMEFGPQSLQRKAMNEWSQK